MVQTKGQIIENSNLLFRLHHQRFYPKELPKAVKQYPLQFFLLLLIQYL